MWICPTCGEPHQDQFKECWKCLGAQLEREVADQTPVAATPTAPERPLRSVTSVLFRVAIGFILGMLAGMAYSRVLHIEIGGDVFWGTICGLITAFMVLIFVWVVFPYKPAPIPDEAENSEQ